MSSSQIFHTAGRRFFNQLFGKATPSKPTLLYLGLRILDGNSGRPADANAADTLTSNLSEVSTSGTGYSRQIITVSTDITEAASGADSLLTIATKTFGPFSATISNVTHVFVATSSDNTGVLLWSAPLTPERSFGSGDTLQETASFTLTQG